MTVAPLVLLAHQGGWDEALVFAVPILVYLGIRFWERRTGRSESREEVVERLQRESAEREGTADPS